MTSPVIGFWDTEWSPAVSYTWSGRPKYLPNEMLVEDPRLLCYGFKTGKKSTRVVDERAGRIEMLTSLRDDLDAVDMLVSFNGRSFDTPKVNSEFMREGLTPPSPYKEVDLYRTIRSQATFYSGKLDFVAERIVGQKKVATGGFQLWKDVLAGDEKAWAKFRRYQKQDVDLLVDLFEQLKPWIKLPHPATDVEGFSCRNCGSYNLTRRGFSLTLNGRYQRYQCECGTWQRGTQRMPVGESRAV